MTQSEPQPELQTLINRGPEWLGSYLRPFEDGEPIPRNMLGIYSGAAFLAVHENSLEWAGIAIRAAALFALQDGGRHRESILRRTMRLRAGFIARMGSRPNHPVLGKKQIVDWFTTSLELSMDEVMEKSARWNASRSLSKAQLTLDELRQLRWIKCRLAVVKILGDCGELSIDSPLKAWLEIYAQIP
jgi:hypothetical protein